jgi:hypothetical protein
VNDRSGTIVRCTCQGSADEGQRVSDVESERLTAYACPGLIVMRDTVSPRSSSADPALKYSTVGPAGYPYIYVMM